MATNEQANVNVNVNGEQAENELNALQKRAKELKIELEKAFKAGDFKGYQKIKKELTDVTREGKKLEKQMFDVNKVLNNLSGASLNDINRSVKELNSRLRDPSVKRGSAEWNRYTGQLQKVKAEQRKVIQEMYGTQKAGGKLTTLFKSFLPAIGFAAIVSGFKSLIGSIINVRKEFEKFEAVLTNALGSEGEAKRMLALIQDFASKTPFSVQELTGAFVKLVNQGFKPTRQQLTSLGDLAASTGKTFDQLTEAIIDAQVGEFERLKEFGIRAQKQGDQVTFTFKGVKQQVDFTEESIRNYITSLGDIEGVAGSMAAISETLGGRISNMGDAWDNFLNALGARTSGVFKSVIDGFTNTINQLTAKFQAAQFMLDAGISGKSILERMFGGKTVEDEAKKMLELVNGMVGATTDEINATIVEVSKKFGYYSGEVGDEMNKIYAYTIKSLQQMILDADKEVEDSESKRLKKFEQLKESLEEIQQDEIISLKEKRAEELITEQQYREQLQEMEIAHLLAMKMLYDQYGQDVIDIENKILDEQIKAINARTAAKQVQVVEIGNSEQKLSSELEKMMEEDMAEWIANIDQQTNIAKDKMAEQTQFAMQFAGDVSNLIGSALDSSSDQAKNFSKYLLQLTLDSLRKFAHAAVARATFEALASAESVATFGIAGLAKAAGMTALIEAAYAAASALITTDAPEAPQYAMGRYPVLGASDGRLYYPDKTVPKGYTGVVKGPALMSELQDEMIINGPTTQKLAYRYPGVLEGIKELSAGFTPQFADGRYPTSTKEIRTEAVIPQYVIDLLAKLDKRLDKNPVAVFPNKEYYADGHNEIMDEFNSFKSKVNG